MIGDHMLRRLASICLFAFAGSASAVVIYDFTESGGNVVGTLSGSIDTSGLSLGLATITSLGINLNPGILLSGSLGLASTTITVNSSFSARVHPGWQTARLATVSVFPQT